MATATLRRELIPITMTIMIKPTMINTKTTSNILTAEMGITMNRKHLLCHFLGLCLLVSRGYYNADANNPYHQDGGYYDGHQQGYQDEYYNDQYYDQGTPAAGQQPHYGQGGYA